ncbi:DUF4031 domain-containing protein [Georgenia alba]|uniref:DUF4031 domain-containing protein n=1 Tax=Georgenia alba TaxID=2233858 RepID=A0ABW2QA98_9MICO
MAILLDPPRWEAHGTVWAHLVSDVSLEELHDFARTNGVPDRSFDLDHYDVPAERVEALLAAGATPVSGKELLVRLRRSGLRVRGADRRRERGRRLRRRLAGRWADLGRVVVDDGLEAPWRDLGGELLDRWSEPHRRYHDLIHLEEVLTRLDDLGDDGEPVTPSVRLAAWFHDAVYDGGPDDEDRSADLAAKRLASVGVEERTAAEVSRLVRLTAGHDPQRDDVAGAVLCDADLGILGASPHRYGRYARAVRAEYGHVPEADFRSGRATVLRGLLGHTELFRTASGRSRWEAPARANMAAELADLEAGTTPRGS